MQYNVKIALKTFDFYMNLDYTILRVTILRSFMEDEGCIERLWTS